jgi:hypothetical protein
MQFDLKKMTPERFIELKEKLIYAIDHGDDTEEIHFHEHVKGIIGFIRALKMKNKMVITALKEVEFIKGDELSVFEKSIQTIAKSEQIDKIINPNKEKKKKWMTTKLSSYLSHILPEAGEKVGGIIAKKLYDKYKNILICKLKRVNSSPKVLELAQKHPNIDIDRLVSLCVLEDKLELANDDLLWLDRIIAIIQEPKALKPAISV